jgi:hypothetical protein
MRERAVAFVQKLHGIVSELTQPLEAQHADRLQCQRGCSACCADDLTVFDVEAERVRRAVTTSLSGATAHAAGGCAFLDPQGACRIYEARPYVCRTQGLPLRWLDASAHDPDQVEEYRDICPLNIVDGQPLALMPADQMWAIGPFEAKLGELQAAFDPDAPLGRTPLRALFEELAAPPA